MTDRRTPAQGEGERRRRAAERRVAIASSQPESEVERLPFPDVAAARARREEAELAEVREISRALSFGYSWAEIGAVYGISRQGAQQRFARRTLEAGPHDPASGAQRR